ncbi:hypothetical protein HNR42_003555 [Deinobacterium chartae]|uniref:DUF2229 domain-containing protein n=1 Tax=Deinobacterium chartae TaxID=521158 RepID=A0A841I6Q3_9DEIO|nr:hypothetical protein [Deinobacterium chartae]MBB6100090.1 hypothetical protein [Deinobacterium chartae]
MKVGLLDTLLPHYLPFWEAFFKELGLTVLHPRLPKAESLELGRQTLPDEPRWVQLAVGRLLELAPQCEAVVVPQLSHPDEREAEAGDPWMADFAEVVAHRLSLPRPLVVPAYGGLEVMGPAAVRVGQELTRNSSRTRLALERQELLLRPRRAREPQLVSPGQHTVAVLAPDLLLEEPLLLGSLPARLGELALHAVYANTLPRENVLAASSRVPVRQLLDPQREVAGAMALLEGKGPVRGLLFPVPERDAALTRLAASLVSRARKPALLLPIRDGEPEFDQEALEAWADRVRLGVAAGRAREAEAAPGEGGSE